MGGNQERPESKKKQSIAKSKTKRESVHVGEENNSLWEDVDEKIIQSRKDDNRKRKKEEQK